ncbi:hypothetical protein ID866_9750 [Astraeus odoratus]|nr:hypothetical protein ID866_9750 [Astraeus odoratus]
MSVQLYNAKDNTKDWNFPKIHVLTHLFDDIIAKGVIQNYNTKPHEKCHGLLQQTY